MAVFTNEKYEQREGEADAGHDVAESEAVLLLHEGQAAQGYQRANVDGPIKPVKKHCCHPRTEWSHL